MKLSELNGKYKVVSQGNSVPTGAGAGFPATETDNRDFLQKTGDIVNSIFPGKKVGEAIGGLAGFALAPKENKPFFDLEGPSPTQVLGDVAAGAATVAGFKGAGATGGILRRAIESAGVGAVMSGGRSTAEGNDLKTVVKDTAIGAATGAAVSGALSGTGAILKSFRALPERLVRSATGQSKKEILAGKDISKYMIENKRIGTADQLISSSQKAIDQADSLIESNLAANPSIKLSLKDVVGDITSSINQSGGEIDEMGVKKILESLAPQVKRTLQKETLTLVEANQLRSQLDKTLGNRAFINAQLPYNKGILMDFTNSLRDQVKSRAPKGTRAAFNTLSKEITLRDLIQSKVAQADRNQIIGLGDILSGGFGGAIGGVPGAIAGAGLKRALESTLTKTGGAVLVDNLDRALSPILEGLEPALQTEIINALTSALSQSTSE